MSLPGEAGRFCVADITRRDQFEKGVYVCCSAENTPLQRITLRERLTLWLGRVRKPALAGGQLHGPHGLLQ
jgi:hypothetical protein